VLSLPISSLLSLEQAQSVAEALQRF
jgi:hypothetical protein